MPGSVGRRVGIPVAILGVFCDCRKTRLYLFFALFSLTNMAALRPTAVRAIAAQRGAFRPSRPVMAAKPVFQPHVGRFSQENILK